MPLNQPIINSGNSPPVIQQHFPTFPTGSLIGQEPSCTGRDSSDVPLNRPLRHRTRSSRSQGCYRFRNRGERNRSENGSVRSNRKPTPEPAPLEAGCGG